MAKAKRYNSLSTVKVKKRLALINLVLLNEYKGSHKKIKVKCLICKKIYSSVASSLWNRGCASKICWKKKLKINNKKKQIKKYGSISDHPHLVKEFMKKNNLEPNEVAVNSRENIFWKCSGCGNEWSVAPRNRFVERIGKNKFSKKYTTCRGICFIKAMQKLAKSEKGKVAQSINKYGSLKDKFPKLLEEWDYDLNIIDPSNISINSNKNVHWKCKKFPEHKWKAQVYNRTKDNPTNCPKCNNFSTSKAEVRVYTELKFIFKKVSWQKIIKKNEIDIYLDNYKFGIEVDGNFHINNESKDIKKNRFFSKLGITILRLRDIKIKNKINKRDIFVQTSKIQLNDIKKIFEYLIKQKTLNKSDLSNAKKYLISNNFFNDKSYKKIVSYLPTVPFEKSLKNTHPNLCKEWSVKNYPLEADFFTYGSNYEIWWNCLSGHRPYKMSILKRTYGENPQGCPVCGRKKQSKTRLDLYLKKNGSLLKKAPHLAKQFMSKKNNIMADKIQCKSKLYAWWYCKKHDHQWQATLYDRFVGKRHNCKFCVFKNLIN